MSADQGQSFRLFELLYVAARWWQDDYVEVDLSRTPTVEFATLDIGGWIVDFLNEEKERERVRQATSLDQAAKDLGDHLDQGIVCPCCGQFAKIYKRRITSTMAASMIIVYRRFGRAWTHIPSETRLSRMGGDWARLAMWGLIEERVVPFDMGEGGPHSGWWRITKLGVKWIHNRVSVPRVVHVYAGNVVHKDEDTVSIEEALEDRFSYAKLMGMDV